MGNLIMPNRGANMGDGWETKRNRTPNNRDWVILKLAHKGTVDEIIVDTCHFKGNYPDSCSIEACVSYTDDVASNSHWEMLLPQQKLKADFIHEFVSEINPLDAITHIRLNIFPDGGISRLRILGKISK
jgi:allantoicase